MNPCNNCALRLFNDKGHNLQGVGNPWCGSAIVLSNVDYEAYKKQDMSFSSQVETISTILSTGGLEQNLYVIPLIRCSEDFEVEITDSIIRRCLIHFYNDVNAHQIKNIMFCGDAARRYLNIYDLKPYLDTVICDTRTKRRIFVNYSPLVKYTNDKLFEVFKSHLLKYYNSIVTKMYDYEVMII